MTINLNQLPYRFSGKYYKNISNNNREFISLSCTDIWRQVVQDWGCNSTSTGPWTALIFCIFSALPHGPRGSICVSGSRRRKDRKRHPSHSRRPPSSPAQYTCLISWARSCIGSCGTAGKVGKQKLWAWWRSAICRLLFLRKTRKREISRQLAVSATVTSTEALFLIELRFPLPVLGIWNWW